MSKAQREFKKWKGRRPYTKKSETKQALAIAKSNKKVLKQIVDFRYSDTGATTGTLNATPVVLFLAMGGTGYNVQMVSCHVKGWIRQNLASVITDDYRMDLVLDREPNKTALTPTLYLASATPTIHRMKVFKDRQRFKILKTWSGHFNENVNVSRKIEGFFPLNLKVKSNTADTFGQAQVLNNALYLVYWTTASANQPTFSHIARVVTKDV